MNKQELPPILRIDELSVSFGTASVVKGLSFDVFPGRTTAVVGESGSGKSVMSMSIMRLADMAGASFPSGRILFSSGAGEGIDLLKCDQEAMRRIRGKEIAMIFQEPMTSLNPVFTIGDQLCEVLILHEKRSRAEAMVEAERLLALVRLPDARALLARYPHQLSGGMRQRVMIAMALACRPKLLIADEPTTALDVTVQAEILNIMKDLQAELGMAMIFITHDMGVVAEMADDVVVMWQGEKVEAGPVEEIFTRPRHPYTRMLLSAVPKLGAMQGFTHPRRTPLTVLRNGELVQEGDDRQQDTADYTVPPLLRVEDLSIQFDVKKSFWGRTTHRNFAVSQVGFEIYPGETLALVGESGSGKSTIGRTIQQLQESANGEVWFDGKPMSKMKLAERQRLRREVQYIFQDPFASLDPRRTVGDSIAEPILTHGLLDRGTPTRRRVGELLERVGLSADMASRYPHEFSGGQRQRVCIARALASRPRLIIADEALSALDVSVQAQVINLFMDLQREEGLAYLFISHDMAVVEKMSHRVAVLYLGQIMEIGKRADVFERTAHPYTQRLLSAVPLADPSARRQRVALTGEIPSSIHPVGAPPALNPLREIANGHFIAQERV
ncbi:glutathione ABC transporter ATP-binding protein GsiA [Salinicola sp. MH3R3-1]|uniref:ABC transporter ATP-binding protein n=1 Tax=Salinicola sp. MH3R3-1 TaxID=1928762 RepID=UPI00094E7B3E|nr:ABC transporter ATP-binding protein [Salinicola sp. MH3R3-1]OLO08344.1 glutathione ABC transporter ATP-binding protein GsiA [Salinicola sp. MH3R3-1]